MVLQHARESFLFSVFLYVWVALFEEIDYIRSLRVSNMVPVNELNLFKQNSSSLLIGFGSCFSNISM